jgi:hypothetical protein
MSKSLTLSMSLAIALSCTGVSFAGHGGCDTCGLASPQGVVASPQASAQSYETCDTCTTKKKHGFNFKFSMPDCFKPKPKCYTYEWVLKKKRVHGHAAESCDTCGTAVTPSAQYASPQGTYAAPQAYGSHQAASLMPTSEMKAPEPAPTGDSVPQAPSVPAPAPAPPAPPVPPATGAQSSLLFLAPAGN